MVPFRMLRKRNHAMKISEAKSLLIHVANHNYGRSYNDKDRLPAILMISKPGIGKTAIVRQAAETIRASRDETYGHFSKILADEDPGVVGGMFNIINGRTTRSLPEWFPTAPNGIQFWDEFTKAVPLLQNTVGSIFYDGTLNGVPFPSGWTAVAACNFRSDRAGDFEMPEHVRTRFSCVEIEPDAEETYSYFMSLKRPMAVCAYLRLHPDHVHTHDPSKPGQPFASPRTWEMLCNILTSALPTNDQKALARGVVGEAITTDFFAFMPQYEELYAKYNPYTIVKSPSTAPIPRKNQPDLMQILATTLGHYVKKVDKNAFPAVVEYMMRLPAEYTEGCMRDIVEKYPDLKETKAYVTWATSQK